MAEPFCRIVAAAHSAEMGVLRQPSTGLLPADLHLSTEGRQVLYTGTNLSHV